MRSVQCFIQFQVTMNLVTNLLLLHLLPREISLGIDVLKYKNINSAVYFHCGKAETVILAQKLFLQHQIRINILNSNDDSYNIPLYYTRIGIIVNTTCEGWPSIFERLNSKTLFKSPYIWFIITENLSSTKNVLSNFPIELDSDVTIISKNGDRLYDLYEVYNTGFFTNGTFVVNKIGCWNYNLNYEKRMRLNLNGVVLKGTIVITQKVVNETFDEYVERSKQTKSDTLHKLKYFTLLKYLRDMYKFSYELKRTNSWGYLHNGSFDGMIGTLQRHEADIGCSPVLFRLERSKVVDAAAEVWKSKPLFILRHPKHPDGYYSIFTRPLASQVWYCLLGLLLISGVILCAMFNMRMLRTESDDDDASSSLALLTIWGAVCQQGTTFTKSSTSINILLFVTFVFTLTIYQYYNATVVSTLLREPPKNIRTAKDLLRSNLKTGVHDVLYNKDFFKRTTDPIALQMYTKKISTATEYNFFTLEHGMALVKRGGFAFLVDNTIAYGIMKTTFSEAEICDAHEVTLYPPENIVAILRKGSPYREHFAYGLRKMFEAGLMHRLKSVWDEPKPACVRTPDTSLISVSILEFSMALVVLVCGVLAAVIVLLCEIALFRFHERRFLNSQPHFKFVW